MNTKSNFLSQIKNKTVLSLSKAKKFLTLSMLVSGAFAIPFLLLFLVPTYICYNMLSNRFKILENYEQAFNEVQNQATKSSLGRVQETFFYDKLSKEPPKKVLDFLQKRPLLNDEKSLIEIFNRDPALKDYLLDKPYRDAILSGNSFLHLYETHRSTSNGLVETFFETRESSHINSGDLAEILALLEGSKKDLLGNPHIVIKHFSLEKVPLTSTYEIFSLNMDLITRSLDVR